MIKKEKISDMLAKTGKVAKEMPLAWMQVLVVVVILVFAVLFASILIGTRKPPKRLEQTSTAPLVKVTELRVSDVQMVVEGTGTVQPKVEVEIVPQISGIIVSLNPNFKEGGFITAGEELLRIDPRDYELAVRQAQAFVAEAQVKLDLEKAEGLVAAQEWEQLHPDKEPSSPFVLRKPQIKQAEARLESTKAQLAKANLDLDRTKLSLPIDVRIVGESVDLGQFAMAGKSVGAAYGVDMFEIEVPLEDKELAWIDIPGEAICVNADDSNGVCPAAEVVADFAGKRHKWQGEVVRTTGQVDITSRFISLVVEVPGGYDSANSRPPLVPGMFVKVLIKGKTVKNVIAVPRYAVHNGNEIWIVNDDRLRIRKIEVGRSDRYFVYKGLIETTFAEVFYILQTIRMA